MYNNISIGPFEGPDEHYYIKGVIGANQEIASGTLWYKSRPIISFSSNMLKLEQYDALSVINSHNDFIQLIGIYYHGNIYPLSRKLLMDSLLRALHRVFANARTARLNINTVQWVKGSKAGYGYLRMKSDNLFTFTPNPQLGLAIRSRALGEGTQYIYTQANTIKTLLAAKSDHKIRYSASKELVGKNVDLPPLMSL